MLESLLEIPLDITFEEAIVRTQCLFEAKETGEISPRQLLEAITGLVKSENGARGFFVNYLTSDWTDSDDPPSEVVQALQSSPDIVAELLTKNLAMSAATALTHRRNGNEEMALSSERVRDRTTHLIKLIELPEVSSRCQELLKSVTTNEGSYKAFLERWGYDGEQRQLITQALEQVIPGSN